MLTWPSSKSSILCLEDSRHNKLPSTTHHSGSAFTMHSVPDEPPRMAADNGDAHSIDSDIANATSSISVTSLKSQITYRAIFYVLGPHNLREPTERQRFKQCPPVVVTLNVHNESNDRIEFRDRIELLLRNKDAFVCARPGLSAKDICLRAIQLTTKLESFKSRQPAYAEEQRISRIWP